MTNQRRKELIAKFSQYADDQDITTTHGTTITNHDARDLLALLREEGLEWKVWHEGELLAAFPCKENAEEWVNGYGTSPETRAKYPITGPGEGENPIPESALPGGCPGCGGPTEYDREDPPNPYYCEKCVMATGRYADPPKSHTNTTQFTGIPENVVIAKEAG